MRYKHRYRWVQMDPETNEAIDIDLQRDIDRGIDINIEIDKDLYRYRQIERDTKIDRRRQTVIGKDRY